MFNFLGSIFGKIASAVVSVFVAVGLISAPASVTPQPVEPVIVETATSTPVSEEEEAIDVKAELDALKKQLADEQKKRKDLEKKVVAPAPVPKPAPIVITPPVVPVVAIPTPTIPVTPAPVAPVLLPGQFLTPSGAIVDSVGNVVKAAPTPVVSTQPVATTTAVTPPPPPTPVWPPVDGSTVDIKQSMISAMNFNPHLTCDQLIFTAIQPSQKNLCNLYKDYPGTSKYIWNIIDDAPR